jgi:hypothetical protein
VIRRLLLVPLLVVAMALPAAADTYDLDDPVDVARGPGDIVSVRLNVTSRWIVWRLELRDPVRFDRAPWRAGSATQIRIGMQQDGADGQANVVVRPGPNGPVATTTAPPSQVCRTQLDQPGGPRTLRVRVHIPCAPRARSGEPTLEIRGRVGYRFDQGGDGTVDQVDAAPNRGYTPYISA